MIHIDNKTRSSRATLATKETSTTSETRIDNLDTVLRDKQCTHVTGPAECSLGAYGTTAAFGTATADAFSSASFAKNFFLAS